MKENYNFNDDGFVVLKNVFDELTLKNMRKLTDDIIKHGEKELEDPFSKYYMRHRTDQGALYDLFQRHPEYQEIAKNKNILDVISTVVGEDIFLYENSLVYKPKNKSNEVPWHQDFINRPDEPIKYIAWIAFDDVTIENGAMKVIPGSHKNGFLPWYHVPGETHHTRLKLEGIDLENYIFVELNAGDVLIFNQLLLHSSDRIESEKPRRAYRISYQGFEQIFTPRSTPIVLAGGKPGSLERKYNKKYVEEPKPTPKIVVETKKNIAVRFLNKVGRKLAKL